MKKKHTLSAEPIKKDQEKKNSIHLPDNYRVGCSGYYYPYWKNRFYPGDIKPKEWLKFYSTVFNSVELNGTFYRTPSLNQLINYHEETPDHFKFSVKMSKYITHVLKLKESTQHINDFQQLIKNGLQKKAGCFLFQLPPSFHFSEENLQRILENIPHQKENVIEFRHISWWNEQVVNALKVANLTFCNVDFPGLNTSFEHTTDHFYLRFHGNPVLFKSSYTIEQLEKFNRLIPENSKQHWIFFNNTYYEAGYTNAKEFMELIAGKKVSELIS